MESSSWEARWDWPGSLESQRTPAVLYQTHTCAACLLLHPQCSYSSGETFCSAIRLWGTYLDVSFLTSVHTVTSLLLVWISIFMFYSRLPLPAQLCVCLSGFAEMQGRWFVYKHTHNHSMPSCLELLPLNAFLSSCPLPQGRARSKWGKARKGVWRQL